MKTKDEKLYIVINVILMLIILVLGIFIYVVIRSNRKEIITGYEQSINMIISSMYVEKMNMATSGIESDNASLVIPIEDDIDNFAEYKFAETRNNKYYYNQLNDNAKLIYDDIEANLANMTSGKYEIKLSNNIANILFDVDGENQLDKNFQSAWDAIMQDRTDTFFIDVTKINLKIRKTTYGNNVSYSLSIVPADDNGYLEQGLMNKDMVNATLNKVKNVRDAIATNLYGSDYDKILMAHDWIIDNLEYSQEIENNNVYNLYGALIDRKAVCEGYAEAFKYIMDAIEIPCIIVSGTATNSEETTENHEWNYVQLDKKWYAVDTTWDDPIVRGIGKLTNSIKHKYFLVGSRLLEENHFANGKITKTGQEFIYPKLQEENYKK